MPGLLHREFMSAVDGSGVHPAPMSALSAISAREAALYPVPGMPSPWDILTHMVSRQGLLLDTVERIRSLDDFDQAADPWPKIDPHTQSEEAWTDLLERYDSGLYRAASLCQARDLSARVPLPRNCTVGGLFLMLTEHNSYHIGQIVTLRRVLGIWPPAEETEGWRSSTDQTARSLWEFLTGRDETRR